MEVKRLFHGTSASNLDVILREGIMLEVSTDELRREGIEVYKASERIYVVAYIPSLTIKDYRAYAF